MPRARAIAQPPVRTGIVGKSKASAPLKRCPTEVEYDCGRGVRRTLKRCPTDVEYDGRGLRTQAKNVEVHAEVARESAGLAGVIVQEVFRQISDVRRRL